MEKHNASSSASRTIPFLSLFILILLDVQLNAQEVKKRKLYSVVISLEDGKKIKGVLYKVNESSLELVKSAKNLTENIQSQVIETVKIKSIAIRKKNSAAAGFILGATIGGALSAVVLAQAYPTESSSSDGLDIDLTPVYLATFITAAGGTIGAATFGKKTYKINGDQSSFDQIKDKLKKCQWQIDPVD